MIRSPSRGTVGLWAGRVPQAISTCSPLRITGSSVVSTSTVCGSVKCARPCTVVTWLRASWARTTSISLAMTFWTRKARSATVISRLTV